MINSLRFNIYHQLNFLVCYLPLESTGWHIILVFITSAGVPIVAAIKPEQMLKYFINSWALAYQLAELLIN